MSKSGYKFIDLFCGCGGFSAGLEMAGHKCLLGVDYEESAVKTFTKNHKYAHGVHMDITKLSKSKLEKLINLDDVDMVVGGPPCQGFSTVGKGEAKDSRNTLFQQFVRIVKLTQPKIVLFENVTGILAKKNEATLKNIFKSFERLGYQMNAQVMSADNYGVPSRRKRTIIMGVKGGVPQYPKISFGTVKKPFITVREALSNIGTRSGVIHNHDVDRAQLSNKLDIKRLKKIPAGCGIRYERDELSYLPKSLRYDVDWDTISEGRFRQAKLQRLPWDEVAPTILTSRTTYYHPEEPRFLTPREAAKCQSFPNNFIFEGSQTAQFRQIGNAVPPLLGKSLGLEIKKIKFNLKEIKKVSFKEGKPEFFENAFTYKNRKRA